MKVCHHNSGKDKIKLYAKIAVQPLDLFKKKPSRLSSSNVKGGKEVLYAREVVLSVFIILFVFFFFLFSQVSYSTQEVKSGSKSEWHVSKTFLPGSIYVVLEYSFSAMIARYRIVMKL